LSEEDDLDQEVNEALTQMELKLAEEETLPKEELGEKDQAELELKELTPHLKYVFLEEGKLNQSIISNYLTQKKGLLRILNENIKALG